LLKQPDWLRGGYHHVEELVQQVSHGALEHDEADLEAVDVEEVFLFVVLGLDRQVVQSAAESL